MNNDKLKETLKDQPAFRYKQAKLLIYKNLISNWSEASNFPIELREVLNRECPLEIEAEIFSSRKDKADKALVTLHDGLKIETVLMRHADGRNTVCVSSQVGCPLGCKFCATGQIGYRRNLTAEEIVGQVLLFGRRLKKKEQHVANVVFMGMGEPFLNYDNVLAAIKTLNDPDGLNIGARHISISTVGLVEGIKKLAKEKLQVNLAVSLHAPNDRLRAEFIPVAKKYPMERLLDSIKYYIDKTNRQVMFEYLMIDGVNDATKFAGELADLLSVFDKKLFVVNLISYNPTDEYKPATSMAIKSFKKILEAKRINATERRRFGGDIGAACGQLVGKHE